MAGLGDIGPPPPFDVPDLASLQYPWSDPAVASPPAPPVLQPGIGVPAAALDAAVLPLPGTAPPPSPADLAGADLPPEPPPPFATAAPDITVHAEQPGQLGVDAISGVNASPLTASPLTPEQLYQQTARQYAGDVRAIPDEAMRQRAENELALRDPVAFGELQVRQQRELEAFTARRRQEMAKADIDATRQHVEDLKASNAATQVKVDALLADSQRIASTKIDPTGGLSGGRAIASVLGAIVGGLVQGRTGSARNAGMDALNDTINRGIEAQKADLVNQREGVNLRRNVLAAEFARNGDMYQAEETVRQAALKHADDLLATEQQSFDPRGRTGLLIASQRQQIAAAQQAAVQTFQQKSFENHLKVQDAARQQQIADETARNNRATTGLGYARLTSEAADRKEARDARASAKQDAADAAKQKQILDRSMGGEVTQVKDAHGKVVGKQLGPITKADGSVWVPTGTETQVSDLQKQHNAATQLVQTLDEIRRVGPEWLLNTTNSDKLQRLKELIGDARLQTLAAKNLGVPTGHDIELAEDFLGTSDPTRYKDSLAGLMQSRASIVRDHNITLKIHGLDKDWDPPDLSKLPTAAAEGDQLTGLTAIEQGQEAKPGAVRGLLPSTSFRDVLTGDRATRNPVLDAEENAVAGPTGLAPEDNAKVLAAIHEAGSSAPAQRADLVSKLAAWAQSPRTPIANGVLGLVHGESPALYDEVVAHLPKEQRDALPDWAGLQQPGRGLPPLPRPVALPEPPPPDWGR